MDLGNIDPDREQQVWQRVLSAGEEPKRNDLRQLQRESMELAAIYRGLSAQLAGKPGELARELYRSERANAAALAGIGVLSRRGGEQLKLWQPGKEPPQKTLEKCYHRSRRSMGEYLARSGDPEYGLVFEKLAKQEADNCLWIAQLLGSLP